ncbi:MAG: YopX family protein [Candidatus Heimdallarchaeaceae archaeon]
MREIKFRAWDKINNRLVDCGVFDGMAYLWSEGMGQFVTEDLPVMQYTGLKDKNGKEIYKNDKIEFTVFDYNDNDTQYSGVVKFSEGGWKIWNNKDDQFYGSDGAFNLWETLEQDCELKVIGNIYENKELSNV